MIPNIRKKNSAYSDNWSSYKDWTVKLDSHGSEILPSIKLFESCQGYKYLNKGETSRTARAAF